MMRGSSLWYPLCAYTTVLVLDTWGRQLKRVDAELRPASQVRCRSVAASVEATQALSWHIWSRKQCDCITYIHTDGLVQLEKDRWILSCKALAKESGICDTMDPKMIKASNFWCPNLTAALLASLISLTKGSALRYFFAFKETAIWSYCVLEEVNSGPVSSGGEPAWLSSLQSRFSCVGHSRITCPNL